MHAPVTELEFAPVGPADEQVLGELFLAARPALALSGLSSVDLQHLVGMQRHAQQVSYAARWPEMGTEVVRRDGHVVAMIMTAEDDDAVYVLDIAVLPVHRGQGIGAAVLQRVIDTTAKAIELTVAVDNPAARLYQRLGFVEVARNATDVAMRRATEAGRAR